MACLSCTLLAPRPSRARSRGSTGRPSRGDRGAGRLGSEAQLRPRRSRRCARGSRGGSPVSGCRVDPPGARPARAVHWGARRGARQLGQEAPCCVGGVACEPTCDRAARPVQRRLRHGLPLMHGAHDGGSPTSPRAAASPSGSRLRWGTAELLGVLATTVWRTSPPRPCASVAAAGLVLQRTGAKGASNAEAQLGWQISRSGIV
jgi:hypothetical protein